MHSSLYFSKQARPLAFCALAIFSLSPAYGATGSGPSAAARTPSHLVSEGHSFSTQPWQNESINYAHHTISKVVFKSQGLDVVGNLFTPKDEVKGRVVVMGPVAFVKEQAPIQYASRLVKEGYEVLIFDPRFHGESAGKPRRYESRIAKVEDIQAAVDFLTQLPNRKEMPIYGLGICQGINWMMEAANKDKRIEKIAMTAGHYLTPDVANMYLGGKENVATRIAQAKRAKLVFEQNGEVAYIPIVSTDNQQALLAAPVIEQFYGRWSDRGGFWNFHGLWENRITQMSELDIWGHDVREEAKKLTTPVLMLHSDHAASGPNIPQEVFALIPADKKQLKWLGARNQMQFYEDPLTIDLVTENLVGFFN